VHKQDCGRGFYVSFCWFLVFLGREITVKKYIRTEGFCPYSSRFYSTNSDNRGNLLSGRPFLHLVSTNISSKPNFHWDFKQLRTNHWSSSIIHSHTMRVYYFDFDKLWGITHIFFATETILHSIITLRHKLNRTEQQLLELSAWRDQQTVYVRGLVSEF